MSTHKVIIAAAGSGKTTHIIREALENPDAKILITTYTIENTEEIKSKFRELNGYVPSNITILPWCSFVLQHLIRPYQKVLYNKRITYLHLAKGQSAPFTKETDFQKHYLLDEETIYSDKAAKMAVKINQKSNGAVIKRLGLIFSHIFIDEIQDLAGYDLEILSILCDTDINTIFVGDPRQSTFLTNHNPKNKNYCRENIIGYFKLLQKKGKIIIDETSLNTNYRSIPEICKFANKIYPEYTEVNYIEAEYDGHHGLYWITEEDIEEYISSTNAIILRHDKRTAVDSRFKCLNYGESKGRTFNHVIIYPTEGILKWLCKGKALAETTRSKFYVAVTRPRYSLAIVDKTGKALNEHFIRYEK